ncbi:MAG: hypothetical protein ACYDAL_15185 [Candidatus Dormibacteraceae bacterium]
MLEAAAAFVVWLGASTIVLADGRRGHATGLALIAVGLAVLAWPAGMAFGAVAIAAGGLVGAVRYWGSGTSTWGIMPAGSTPRLVMCIAAGLLALWLALSVTTGPDASLRFAVLVVLGLMGGRILMTKEAASVVPAIAAFALALGAAPGLAAGSSGPVPAIVAGLAAAGVVFVPASQSSAPPSTRSDQDGA